MLYEVITPCGGGANAHLAAAVGAIDVGEYHLVAAHAASLGVLLGLLQCAAEFGVESYNFV